MLAVKKHGGTLSFESLGREEPRSQFSLPLVSTQRTKKESTLRLADRLAAELPEPGSQKERVKDGQGDQHNQHRQVGELGY
jgi:hypothetical protein